MSTTMCIFFDPIDNTPVYIGKGTGYRAWTHLSGNSHNRELRQLIKLRSHQGYDIGPIFFDISKTRRMLLSLKRN